MSKVAFSSDKYQAVIVSINAALARGVAHRDLRGVVMKEFKAGPDGNRGTLGGVEMTKNGLSTYIANVKDHFGLNEAKSGAPLATIVTKSTVMSIVKVDEYDRAVQVKYYQGDDYLEVDTKGLHLVKGYQIVGQRLGACASTALTLDEGQELEI